MGETVTEKRRSERVKGESLVKFEGSDFSIYSKVTDISEVGAFVATHYLLDPGTDIDVSIIDPSGKESIRKARVIRHTTDSDTKNSKVGLGVEFLHMKGSEATN